MGVPDPARGRLAPLAPLLALLLAALTAACSPSPGRPAPPAPGPPAGPAAAAPSADAGTDTDANTDTDTDASPFWVDPRSAAARQVAAWDARGRSGDAQVLRRISEQPMALWAAPRDPGREIRRAAGEARAAGRTLVLTAHHLPYRACGPRAAGGAAHAQAYRTWLDAFAAAIGDTKAVVVLEPDAVVHLVDGCTEEARHEERYRLLSQAVDRLKKQRHTRVYLDAGGPASVPDAGRLARPLLKAGLARADGFAVNVAGFGSVTAARAYGARISERTGGEHFVIDTGRAGDGPPPGEGPTAWCNPPGRSLGPAPTDRTGDPLVDAYLWVKRPGESDGACRGGPPEGAWWPDYALGLARRAR
ncbi:glycoside hydrolase family 6 protein [Streptomyces sp. NPDC090022]|uniref:glycoside hydrolase family 6 protein n=1 Tax=Streptomyces sp. NPDC090022 TaxID=3365920 RepID=UPI00382D0427